MGGFESRITVLGGMEVRVTSYPVGKRFSSRVDNIDPGANIGRGMASSREEAEQTALLKAARHLGIEEEDVS